MARWKGFDLYLRYRKLERKNDGHRRRGWLLAAVAAAVFVLAWQLLEFRNRGLEEKLEGYWAWLDDPRNVSSYKEAVASGEIAGELKQRIALVGMLTARLACYPKVDSALLARVSAVGGAEIRATVQSYDSGSGELVLQAESESAIDASGYVKKLEGLGVFQTVYYNGYVWDDERYRLQVRCVLRGAGGEEGQDAAGHIER